MSHKNQTNSYTEFFYKTFRNILIISIPLVIVSAIILSSLHISATGSGSSTDTLFFNISSSCTLSSVVDSSHNAELINGTYVDGIGQTTITTLCNDGNGYSIYANGYSNNEEGNNKLVNTENSNFNIISGTAQSGTTSNWAMSLNNLADDPSLTPPTIENTYNNTYGIVPNEWTKVASLPARATDMIKGSSFTTTYAVYTSSSQYAGTYNGQVKYMLVHPSYKPAVYFMQDVASWKDQLALEESVQAVDKRDGKSYWVTKLADGNIWMTQNLDFDIDTTKTYTHNDTDLGWSPNSFDINAVWKPDYPTIDFDGTIVSGWKNNYVPQSANPGEIYYYTSGSDADDESYGSLEECVGAGHIESDCRHYHVGNYYNWTAAMASNNNLTRSENDVESSICPANWRLPSIYEDEFMDLLLSYGVITISAGSISYTADGFDIIREFPLYFVRSGGIEWNSNKLTGMGGNGSYWSSTATSYYPASYLQFSSNNIKPNTYNINNPIKYVGWSVRCVAR